MKRFVILDGAHFKSKMDQAILLNENHHNLYTGISPAHLEPLGPFIFEFPHNQEFYEWYMENVQANSRGLIVESIHTFNEVKSHFKTLIKVRTESGHNLFFRFYDSRVIRSFLPTCQEAELIDFFGPVQSIFAQSVEADILLNYRIQNKKLITEKIELFSVVYKTNNQQGLNSSNKTKESEAEAKAIDNNIESIASKPNLKQPTPPNRNAWID
jgi:Domain of unknown function (DUF4123)